MKETERTGSGKDLDIVSGRSLRKRLVRATAASSVVGAFMLVGVLLAFRPVARWLLRFPEPRNAVGEVRETVVATRDEVPLSTTVTLPEGEGPWPVVVIRNPYDLFDAFRLVCETFAETGYACVHQDVRGRMGSSGEWRPLVHEGEDGLDLLAWLKKQPFQNGRWALWGMSYMAGVQWAMADRLPEEVRTLVSMMFGVDTAHVMYEGGLFHHDVFSAWAAFMPGRNLSFENGWLYSEFIRHRPHLEADQAVLGIDLPWYREWIDAFDTQASLWTSPPFSGFIEAPTRVKVPVLMMGGWFDPFFDAQRRDFERLRTRHRSKLLIGPWHHFHLPAADFSLPEDLSLGEQWQLVVDWLDHHLQDKPLRQARGVVETYDLGAGGWHRRPTFSSTSTRTLRLWLQAPMNGDDCPGILGSERPEGLRSNPLGRYRYDPDDPTPSVGGASALAFAIPTFAGPVPGARAQPEPCFRPDLLSFVSEPAPVPLRVSGPIRGRLEVRSTAPQTAFGFEVMVKAPGRRWVHMREVYAATRLETVNGPQTVELRTWPIEWTLPAGTRIRTDVRSASFPLFAAHPNVAGPWGQAKAVRVAEQTLYTGSWIELTLDSDAPPVLSVAALSTVPTTMACSFDIDLPAEAEVVVKRAEKMITGNGGTFSGDTSTGNYTVKLPIGGIEGKYSITETSIRFEVTKKPMLVPCSAIEKFIRDQFKR